MILLLDAHTALWALVEPQTISTSTRESIESPANDVVVSAASIWELEIKRAIGKIEIDVDLVAGLERAAATIVPILGADAIRAARLPMHHRDPFDRMLVAQAQRLGAVLVTRDPAFARYDVEVLAA